MTATQINSTTVTRKPTTTPLGQAERDAILADPGFGRYFTDHMVLARWTVGQGWHDAELVPYGPLQLDPATMVLHYSQEIFEGLKAYRRADGSIAVFRPDANSARLNRSAARLAMPALPEALFVEAVTALVETDAAWVPSGAERSLYIRPFMIATEVALGVHPSNSYLFVVIASPAGAYFQGGIKPVSVWLSEDYTRAAPGGTGDAKTGGNYAASLSAQAEASGHGCDQVVWLDALEHKVVEEMGGMNLYFVHGSPATGDVRIVTPALTGTLLAGITRDSLLAVAADLGWSVEEGTVTTDDWEQGNASGEITEVFACGTAAVITPVGEVKAVGRHWSVGDGGLGPVTAKLRETLLGIQTGTVEDTHGWTRVLVPAPSA
jgi:branched-chain amino acid aminotransferase